MAPVIDAASSIHEPNMPSCTSPSAPTQQQQPQQRSVNSITSILDENVLHQYPAFHIRNLPLVTVNHISFAVPFPKLTASFFIRVLGFNDLHRPPFIDSVDGAWICGLGIELHFIEKHADPPSHQSCKSRSLTRLPSMRSPYQDHAIDTRNDHLSFLCSDHFDAIVETLKTNKVQYVLREFPGPNNLRQVFFSDPTSGILIEVSTNPRC